jgi:hypothetical protein
MITYSAYYELGKTAMIRKTVETADATFVSTGINFYNLEEREFLTDEIIAQHLENLLLYFKEVAASSSIIPTGSNQTTQIIPEWPQLSDIFQEIISWWTFLSYRPETDESDHYHDPVTGEHTTEPAAEETAP